MRKRPPKKKRKDYETLVHKIHVGADGVTEMIGVRRPGVRHKGGGGEAVGDATASGDEPAAGGAHGPKSNGVESSAQHSASSSGARWAAGTAARNAAALRTASAPMARTP